jgi:hypothetical protein
MNRGILCLEFKGFTAMATILAKETEDIGISAERIRAAGITVVESVLNEVTQSWIPLQREHLGGDTWALVYNDVEEAIASSCIILKSILKMATEKAVYFLKPKIAIGVGSPSWKNGRPLDDASILAYRVADNGKSYCCYLVEDAINVSRQYNWVKLGENTTVINVDARLQLVDWQNSIAPGIVELSGFNAAIPLLLLDNEIIFSRDTKDAIKIIRRYQKCANTFLAFGGPVPYDIPEYREYLLESIQRIRNDENLRLTILTYLPLNELKYCYFWVELMRRLSINYPDRMACAAYVLPDGQLRPQTFHIYDTDTVFIGLRTFIPHRGLESMTSSITFRNVKIAQLFKNEFMGNYRKIGLLDDAKMASLLSQLGPVDNNTKRAALAAVEELLSLAVS